MVYRIEFERAIAFEEKSVVERIQLADMAVEPDYDGMLWNVETDPISDAFIQDMTQRFRDQKKIHRKYAYKVGCLTWDVLTDWERSFWTANDYWRRILRWLTSK